MTDEQAGRNIATLTFTDFVEWTYQNMENVFINRQYTCLELAKST